MKILILLVIIILNCGGCAANTDDANSTEITANKIVESKEGVTEDDNMENSEVLLELCSDEEVLSLSTQEIEVRLLNNSEQVILTGEAYAIEVLKNDEWIEVPISISYEDIGYIVGTGEAKKFVCMLDGISESGLYRIRKSYSADSEDGNAPTEYVYVEFQVKSSLEK